MTAPWQVYVPGFLGEEYDSYPDAKRALKRLRKLDRRRRRPSSLLSPPGGPLAPVPGHQSREPGSPEVAMQNTTSYAPPRRRGGLS